MMVVLGILLTVSCLYQILATGLGARFQARRSRLADGKIRASQIKPVRTVSATTLQAMESFLSAENESQSDFYVCSGESAPTEWCERHPQVTWLRLPADQSQNGKAATLALGEPYWSGDIFVISDADMVCGPDYLSHVLGEFQDPEVGVVTSLYRGVAKDGWKIGSLFESLCILDFASSVLVAEKVEGVTFAMGSTMAIRREVLQQIGGFEALKSYLADDFQLGFRAAQKGWRVALAPLVLDTHLTHSNLRQALEHQYRWLVTSRVSRPLGHAAFLLTQGMLWSALLSWFVAQVWPLALWCALRIFLGTQQSRLLQGVSSKPFWPHLFLPFKDILFLGLWVSSHFGHRVKWGEKMIEIDGQGRIVG